MNEKKIYFGLLMPFTLCAQEIGQEPEQEQVVEIDPEHAQEQAALQAADAGTPVAADTPVEASAADVHAHEEELEEESEEEGNEIEAEEDESLFEAPEYARGNWYKKQQTLKQAHDAYQEVRQKEAAVAQYEATFIAKKNELTNKLESFVQTSGIALSGLYEAIVRELEAFDTVARPQGPATQEDRVKMAQAQEAKAQLEQLQKDINSVTEFYKAIDDAMGKVMQHITTSHQFEQSAFENYEKIAHVLSDQVAEQLYAEIVASRDNISAISDYLKGDFTHYFDEVTDHVDKTLTLVQQQVVSLKERGVDLLKKQEEALEKPAPSAPIVPEKKEIGYFTMIWNSIGSFFSALANWIRGFFV